METNAGPRCPVPAVCKIPCCNMRSLARNFSDLIVASSQYDILLCSETFVSDMRHVSQLLVPGLLVRHVSQLLVRVAVAGYAKMPQAQGMAAYIRNGYGTFRLPKFVCGCCEMIVFGVCGARQNLHVFSLYRNTDLDDRIFVCLLTSMGAAQAEGVRASFLFVGDFNGHHQEWLGSTTTNRHGDVSFDFATVSSCNQLIIGPTHARGGTLNLLMTDATDLVGVAILANIGNSDHASLTAVISMAQAVPNLLVEKFSLNIKVI